MILMNRLQKTREIPVQNCLAILLNLLVLFGGGVAFKISNRFNIALEDRVTFIKDDLLDGQQWAEQGDSYP